MAGNQQPVVDDLDIVQGAVVGLERQDVNPLMLLPISRKLFGYLSLQDLARGRQVCKYWRNESLLAWRSTSTVKFTSGKPFPGGQDDDYEEMSDVLIKFMDFWGNLAEPNFIPFRQFQFDSWAPKIDPESGLRISQFRSLDADRFFREFGLHITTLTLNDCSFVGVGEVRMLLYQACPNLQRLNMRHCKVLGVVPGGQFVNYFIYEYKNRNELNSCVEPSLGGHQNLRELTLDKCLPDSWMNILSRFASLQSLTVSGNLDYHTPKLLNAIKAIREHDSRKLPLKQVAPLHLQYGGESSWKDFELMRKLALKLGSFRFIIFNDLEHHRSRDILVTNAESLKEVNLVIQGPTPFQFPRQAMMPNLYMFGLIFGLCENWHFIMSMPNLQKLELKQAGRIHYEEDGIPAIKNMFANTSSWEIAKLKLALLKEFCSDYLISGKNLRNLLSWIPNVKKLRMPFNDDSFGIVCITLVNLVELRDVANQITDMGVIGYQHDRNPEKEDGDVQPIISQLKALEILVLKSSKLTEEATLRGFVNMTSLKKLALPSRNQIGKEGEAALTEKGVEFCYLNDYESLLMTTDQINDDSDSESD